MPAKKSKAAESDDPKNPSSVFKSLMATLNKEDRDLLGAPSANQSDLTIYFTIKDKPHLQKGRKDSLLEFAQKRERTHSQTVDFISAQSLNHVVQQLIDNEFAVFKDFNPKPKKKKGVSPR